MMTYGLKFCLWAVYCQKDLALANERGVGVWKSQNPIEGSEDTSRYGLKISSVLCVTADGFPLVH